MQAPGTALHTASASSWRALAMGGFCIILEAGVCGKACVWREGQDNLGVNERFQGRGEDLGKVGVCGCEK